ncbi:PQ loop repeat-domain-containing protein [Chytriomyces cf. hyalinus JEL632]|nr:PQ loop repeat-domain-containing protein [Chytriomyces cf. hyalinus JEL632]
MEWLTSDSSQDCVCRPAVVDGYNYVKVIGVWFGDCVHTPREISSFVLGLLSLICFAVAFFPQIWLNYTRKSVEGLSWGLMVFWVFGDIGNLLGSLYTKQLPLQIYVASYFILLDVITLLQIVWYGTSIRERLGLAEPVNFDEVVVGDDESDGESGEVGQRELSRPVVSEGRGSAVGERTALLSERATEAGGRELISPTGANGVAQQQTTRHRIRRKIAKKSVAVGAGILMVILVALFVDMEFYLGGGGGSSTLYDLNTSLLRGDIDDGVRLCDAREAVTPSRYTIGCIFSWVSGLLYFFSRTSQIQTNHERKSVEGVSIALFILTLTANLMYGLQILIRGVTFDSNFYLAVLPFIIGSTGTLIFDSILIYQAWIYGGFL